MAMRKILAVVLCVCAVLSVMAVVAHSINADPVSAQVGAQDISALPTTPAPTTTTKPLGDQIADGWEQFKPYFDMIYKFFFQGFSQTLVVGFQWLLSLVGLNFWEGGLFGILA